MKVPLIVTFELVVTEVKVPPTSVGYALYVPATNPNLANVPATLSAIQNGVPSFPGAFVM